MVIFLESFSYIFITVMGLGLIAVFVRIFSSIFKK